MSNDWKEYKFTESEIEYLSYQLITALVFSRQFWENNNHKYSMYAEDIENKNFYLWYAIWYSVQEITISKQNNKKSGEYYISAIMLLQKVRYLYENNVEPDTEPYEAYQKALNDYRDIIENLNLKYKKIYTIPYQWVIDKIF